MESLLLDILAYLREHGTIGRDELAQIIRRHNENIADNARHYAKKRILPFYFETKQNDEGRWRSWDIGPELEGRLIAALQMKPRRTASGVATITVITKPQPCGSACVYCPNDLRMPKSYLSDEPACQRAERNFFDPYLQVASRMRALTQMGHTTDKVELIVLGGTWSDYPRAYQIWFVSELFRALNDWPIADAYAHDMREEYRALGLSNSRRALGAFVQTEQAAVDAGESTYNESFHRLYDANPAWVRASARQQATFGELAVQQRANETAAHRVVGLVIETRPDTVTPDNLRFFRQLGCTKIQIGVQSTDTAVLKENGRHTDAASVARAFTLIRLYGFKIHSHLMVNLVGATPETDKRDFERFVTDPAFLPDEIKLYPCALVHGTRLVGLFESGGWRPYTESELLDVLVSDTLATPPYVRISRMIRDIGANDILVGNKKTNLRQMVEQQIKANGQAGRVREIRFREINRDAVDFAALALTDFAYATSATAEHFLQWVTPEGKIVGFLRLSLPEREFVRNHAADLAVGEGEAMIREVHVYGQAAHLGKSDAEAQHLGLGRGLVERAIEIAYAEGYTALNVISSVGTREYYRHLGFADNGLYQTYKRG